jgi:hypothetical protein
MDTEALFACTAVPAGKSLTTILWNIAVRMGKPRVEPPLGAGRLYNVNIIAQITHA